MMKWGRTRHVSSSSSSTSSGLSRALPVSWFSKLSGSSVSKPATDKKQEDKGRQNMSAKSSLSSTKRQSGTHDISKSFQRVEKKKAVTRSADMGSNEKFEETMSSVRKKVRDLQRETCGFIEVDRDKGTVIMTPRIHVNRDKQRRDRRLLEQKPKRTEQGAEVKARRIGTGQYGREDSVVAGYQWQKLKERKLREVKLKVDQQRKSQYIKRELNSKVRVFSPRTSEKCRVKVIEDLKKAKMRATEDGGKESESFAVVKCSRDPQKDFRDSMIEMIMENSMNEPEELKELLVCYLRLNTDEYHEMIIEVFKQVYNDLNFH